MKNHFGAAIGYGPVHVCRLAGGKFMLQHPVKPDVRFQDWRRGNGVVAHLGFLTVVCFNGVKAGYVVSDL
jgi:hypothetical protein